MWGKCLKSGPRIEIDTFVKFELGTQGAGIELTGSDWPIVHALS